MTARFSIVVLAHNVAEYLDAALSSIRAQTFPDFEVLALDNGSPDGCGAIIDRYAGRDARFRPIHLANPVDMGPARNVGIARATGEYLLFLDGDDTFADRSSLAVISRRLDVAGTPDVLLYDFDYRRHCGLTKRSNLGRILPASPRRFLLRDRPEAILVSWTCWNKAYRRSFVQRGGLSFPPGYYEDSVWSSSCLLSAESISVLEAVCVGYRCCRPNSVTRSLSDRHTDVFEQYERIFNFLDSHPDVEFDGIRAMLLDSMAGFLTALGGSRMVIPVEKRADFRRRARRYVERRRHLNGPVDPH
ncbi:glycosyltransferase family 2 protein [Microbispora cellulosiformans]|uniref:Glycosyltransferase family 2 protein n=1 Tax=Microbispora cellulosiformans TaxID=2614688 RepID=A0A5J5KAX4_9ACTN|nr:glycosyltransferase family 2 protein [Microbispora cellulosiformans]KAA9381413.1 glycosyltransferase family 2 protein [Microbispora cellulosiformans]